MNKAAGRDGKHGRQTGRQASKQAGQHVAKQVALGVSNFSSISFPSLADGNTGSLDKLKACFLWFRLSFPLNRTTHEKTEADTAA